MKKKEVILVVILGVMLAVSYLIDPDTALRQKLSKYFCLLKSGQCSVQAGETKGGPATPSSVPIAGPKAEYDCYASMFNPATVTDVEGTVGAVAQNPNFPPVMRMELQTNKGIVPVLFAPEFYLKEKNFIVKPGDRIVVRGSKISYEGHNILVAKTMKKNGKSIAFRDDKGALLWMKSDCEK